MFLSRTLGFSDYQRFIREPKKAEEFFWEIDGDYREPLQRYVVACGRYTLSREDVQDVTQETFFRLIKHMQTETDIYNKIHLPAWLFLVASRIVIDRFRKQGARKEIEFDENFISPESPDYDGKLAVQKALLALSEDQRFIMIEWAEGSTIETIAELLGEKSSQIAWKMQKSKEVMRAEMGVEWE